MLCRNTLLENFSLSQMVVVFLKKKKKNFTPSPLKNNCKVFLLNGYGSVVVYITHMKVNEKDLM